MKDKNFSKILFVPPLVLFRAGRQFHGVVSSFVFVIEVSALVAGLQQGSIPFVGIVFLHMILVAHALLVTGGLRGLTTTRRDTNAGVHRPSLSSEALNARKHIDPDKSLVDCFTWAVGLGIPVTLLQELSHPFRVNSPSSSVDRSGNREGSINGGLFSPARCGICGEPSGATKHEIRSSESPAPDHHACAEEAHEAIQHYLDVLKNLWLGGIFDKEVFRETFNRVYKIRIYKSFGRTTDLRQEVLLFTMRTFNQLFRSLDQAGPINPKGVAALISCAAWFSDIFVADLDRPVATDETNALELRTRWDSTLTETLLVSDFMNSTASAEMLDQIVANLFSRSADSGKRGLAFRLERNERVLAQAIIGYRRTTSRSVRDYGSVTRTEGGKFRYNTTHWDWGVSTGSGSISPRNRTTQSRTVSSSYHAWSDAQDAHIVVTTRQVWFQTLDKVYAGIMSYSKMGMLSATEEGFHFLRTKAGTTTEAFVESPYMLSTSQGAIAPLIGGIAQIAFQEGLEIESRISQLTISNRKTDA